MIINILIYYAIGLFVASVLSILSIDEINRILLETYDVFDGITSFKVKHYLVKIIFWGTFMVVAAIWPIKLMIRIYNKMRTMG